MISANRTALVFFQSMLRRKIFNKSLRASDKCAVFLIRCPLYPQKRTFAVQLAMSALCQ